MLGIFSTGAKDHTELCDFIDTLIGGIDGLGVVVKFVETERFVRNGVLIFVNAD